MGISLRRIVAMALLFSGLLSAPQAHALSSDQRVFMRSGLYGAGVGALAGLASMPLNKSGRSIWIGASLGLYLGMIMGVYLINHKDDPENPILQSQLQNENARAGTLARADFKILNF